MCENNNASRYLQDIDSTHKNVAGNTVGFIIFQQSCGPVLFAQLQNYRMIRVWLKRQQTREEGPFGAV